MNLAARLFYIALCVCVCVTGPDSPSQSWPRRHLGSSMQTWRYKPTLIFQGSFLKAAADAVIQLHSLLEKVFSDMKLDWAAIRESEAWAWVLGIRVYNYIMV